MVFAISADIVRMLFCYVGTKIGMDVLEFWLLNSSKKGGSLHTMFLTIIAGLCVLTATGLLMRREKAGKMEAVGGKDNERRIRCLCVILLLTSTVVIAPYSRFRDLSETRVSDQKAAAKAITDQKSQDNKALKDAVEEAKTKQRLDDLTVKSPPRPTSDMWHLQNGTTGHIGILSANH